MDDRSLLLALLLIFIYSSEVEFLNLIGQKQLCL